MTPKRWLPKYVTAFVDRHGKRVRYRFRRKGEATHYFKASPGTPEFVVEYNQCLKGESATALDRRASHCAPGTVDHLLECYYQSPDFQSVAPSTKRIYRASLERWRARYGVAMVRDATADRITSQIAELLPHKTAANMLRKRLHQIWNFAIRMGLAKHNPVAATKPYKIDGDGYHSWTEAEIAQYEARHPVGTMARLMLDLLQYTGQRIGDVHALGPQNIKSRRIELRQQKTGARLSLPILAPLAESIMATKSGPMAFIVRTNGQPFTEKGISNRFRKWCNEAGLYHCSAHGVRKAAARRLAESGCSNQEIKAWTGHKTDFEVARYTAAASQSQLSDAGAARLMANLAERVSHNGHSENTNPIEKAKQNER